MRWWISCAPRESATRPDTLPHRFPFRLVDGVEVEGQGRCATVLLSHAAFLDRGAPWPVTFAAEALAQAILLVTGEARPDVAPRLVGLDHVRLRQLLRSGDVLRVEVEEEGAFGALRRFHCRATRAGALAVEAAVTVST